LVTTEENVKEIRGHQQSFWTPPSTQAVVCAVRHPTPDAGRRTPDAGRRTPRMDQEFRGRRVDPDRWPSTDLEAELQLVRAADALLKHEGGDRSLEAEQPGALRTARVSRPALHLLRPKMAVYSAMSNGTDAGGADG
jgi:hypothetical protein